jgi:hypothetical protein
MPTVAADSNGKVQAGAVFEVAHELGDVGRGYLHLVIDRVRPLAVEKLQVDSHRRLYQEIIQRFREEAMPISIKGRAFLAGGGWREDVSPASVSFENGHASFHLMSLGTEGINKSEMGIQCSCIYITDTELRGESPWLENGEDCPVSDAGKSRYIMAFRARLTGRQAANHTLSYSANVIESSRTNPSHRNDLGSKPSANGSWAGATEVSRTFSCGSINSP